MSVVPLKRSDGTGKSSKLRAPPGTASIPYGYRLSGARVNLTYDEPSRLPGNDTSSSLKPPSNQANGVPPDDRHSQIENGQSHSEKNVDNDQSKAFTEKPSNGITKSSKPRDKRFTSKKQDVRIAIFPINPNVEKDEDIARENRELDRLLRAEEFIEKTNRGILGRKFRNLVDEGITEYDRLIEARREKLRAKLLSEEKCLTREIIDQAQRGADLRMEEMRKREEELRARKEEIRLATVREKRARQYLERCPEARNRFTRDGTLERKYSNLVQIAEKEAKRESERDLENLWHELMLKGVESERALELEKSRRRMDAEKSIAATLEKQIAGKLALREEEKRIKDEERENLEKHREAEIFDGSNSPGRRREKMAKLRRDLDEQLSATRKLLAERAREEEAVDRAFRIISEEEISRERSSREESTSRLRREIAAYMSSLEKFKSEEATRRAEFDSIVAANAKDFEARRDQARRKSREDRELMMSKVLQGREQQLMDKQAEEQEAKRRTAYESELQLREAEAEALIAAEDRARKRASARLYAQELKAQQEHTAAMKRRENEEIERARVESLQRDRKAFNECEEIAERTTNAKKLVTPSSLRTMLKETTAKWDEARKICSSADQLRAMIV